VKATSNEKFTANLALGKFIQKVRPDCRLAAHNFSAEPLLTGIEPTILNSSRSGKLRRSPLPTHH
jgi:hypothetical protein